MQANNAVHRLILALLVWPGVLYANPPHLRFNHLATEDGLSHNSVYAIFQDRQGFMWFGTYVGLSKYDGYKFTRYQYDSRNPQSLSHNVVLALCEDAHGDLWIGTAGGGLNRFDRKTEQFVRYQHDPQNPHSLSDDNVVDITTDPSGQLWIATRQGGLNRFEPATNQFVHYQHHPAMPPELSQVIITAFFADHLGVLWVGTMNSGLYRVDPHTEQVTRYDHDPTNPYSISDNYIIKIFEDRQHMVWVGTFNGGLNQLDGATGQFRQFRHDPANPFSLSSNSIDDIVEDTAGRLWIGTANQGMNRFDPATGRFIRYQHDRNDPASLNDDRIRALYRDRSGVLWIGTKTGGINTINWRSEQFLHYANDPDNPQSLSHNEVYALHEDHTGALWIGTRGGGLNRFDPMTGQWTHYRHEPNDPSSLSHDRIRTIYEDRQGILWVGTDSSGLNRFDPTTGQFRVYQQRSYPALSDHITTIYEDRAGHLWIGTNTKGFLRFDRTEEQFVSFSHDPNNTESLSHNSVTTLYEDRAGNFWVGTYEGLNQCDRATGRCLRYRYDPTQDQSLSDNYVICLHEDRAGRFWVGTNRGLNQMNRATGEFTRYEVREGLPNDTILGILEDPQGNLWMSTNKGICRFHPERQTFKHYDQNDNLQGDEFNFGAYGQTRDGRMMFGGMNGFNMFDPAYVTENAYVPPIVLTDFQLFHQPVPIGDTSVLQQAIGETTALRLPYDQRIFSFEFAALNYITPERNQYRYRMEGFKEDWNVVDSKRRIAIYTNLPAGQYQFHVQGSNNDGVWNIAGTSVTITIIPPYWQTWWFRLNSAILIIAMLVSGYTWRVKALQRRKRELEQQVQERTQTLRNEIEERNRAEQALRASEERFRSIVETAPGMLHITDTQGKNLYISPNCEQMTGYSQAELIEEFHWWVHPDDDAHAKEVIKRAYTEGIGQQNFEYKAIKKNGDIWYASSSWEALRDGNGTVTGLVAQTIDITERKHAEEELHRLYQQAQRDAAIKAELLREVNHRVGNNLTAIAGMLSLERHYFHGQAASAAYLNLTQNLTARINGLAKVHELLSASLWSPLPLEELIRQVIHSSLQILPFDTYLKVDVSPSPIRVNADQAHHLALIVNELATNVVKYAVGQRNAAHLTIRISQADSLIQLLFQDDGPGYPEDVLRFERRNVGLDLIHHLICRNLQGRWRIQNDQGAVTILEFPVVTETHYPHKEEETI